ncbi:MAG: polysaccharide biosynthesis protein [Clostridia bacterium]|nr:polysaccharide biosynthesis protein [Clostridia bacterium]
MSSKSETKQQSFLHGSIILIVATVLAKIIGAVYRIPLTNILGSSGMGYYSTAYDLYVPMYSIAMAGLPIAISRIVAEYSAKSRYKDVTKTLRAAQLIFLVTGGTGFVLMVLLAFLLTGAFSLNIFGLTLNLQTFNSGALSGILAIAPSLAFCCIMSAYRGYFEGLGNMTPTGISEILEALGKLVFGFTLASIILKTTNNYSLAAAGALVGITLGEALSTLFLLIRYRLYKWKDISKTLYLSSPEPIGFKSQIKGIIIIAIPIVLGSLVNNITSLIDVVMVQKQLSNAVSKAPEYFAATFTNLINYEKSANSAFDMAKDLPNSLYGCHRGFAFSIYNLIPVLTSTLGVSAIPVLAKAWIRKDPAEIKSNIETIIRTVAIIALPCGAGIFALSYGILSLLYSNEAAIAIAAPNLRILGVCAVFAGINAPLVNMLQAIGKEKIPLKNIAVGAVVKIVINYCLVGIPSVNIVGVPIGTTLCYGYICIANFVSIIKYSGVKPNYRSVLIKPVVAGVICGISAYICYFVLNSYFFSVSLSTVISIAFAAIIYLIMISLLKVIEPSDILSLPMGDKVLLVAQKLKIVRKS